MKISSLGTATLGCALALAAGSVFANVTPNLPQFFPGANARTVSFGNADTGANSRSI